MKKTNTLSVVLLLVVLSGLLVYSRVEAQSSGPELPRVLLDTQYVPPTGATINVPAGGDFQAALNAAQPGDQIVLQAGAVYTTPPDGFVLPNKSGSNWIVIRTSNLAGLPAEGTRVTPANTGAMAKVVTTGLWPAVKTASAAHHFRFVGVEFAIAPALPQNYGIVTLGEGSSVQSSLAQVPHDLVIDRCYIHGNATVNVSRGVALNSARTAIIDSTISDCHGVGYDTQAIAGWNGPGPFKIVNNYLEGAAENVIFGGSPPAITNLIPSDIEFRRNTCYKPLSWKTDDPSYAGIPWSIKNIFELKNAMRVLVDGNTFENIWVSGQSGFAIQWTPRGESGAAPWAAVQDITFSNNIVRHAAAAINLLGYDDSGPSQQTRRVRIANNLFDDIGAARWGGNGRFLQILDGTADVTVEHNTVFHTAHVIIAEGRQHTGFVYRNNLSPHNTQGVAGTGTATGLNTLNTYFPGYVFAKNLLAGGPAASYPAGNFFPASLNDVGFVDLSGGNYRLLSSSPYKGAGTDGKDIGADIDAIQSAINGAGAPPPTPPPPSPPPPSGASDIVLYASRATVKVGAWQVTSDASAASGAALWNADVGLAKLTTPLANPNSYFEMTFNAQAGTAYHLWMRSRAQNDSPYNDSVHVQFSDSVNASGAAVYRIGTTTSTEYNLEDCSGCGLSGWGWQDNGWGVGVMGSNIYFAATGTHTIRVQPREDGIIIDQIVLSPVTYLNASPGALKNDHTILPETGAPPPAVETVLLADDFNDNSLDLSKWNTTTLFSGFTDTGVAVAETNQRIEIGPLPQNASGSHYCGIRAARSYDFTGAYCIVALTQAPAANTAADAMFTVGQDANSYYRIYVEAGTLICQKRINGTKTNLLVATYDAVNHRYWRIRHDAATGAVVFETAPDNGGVPGTWTERCREAWNTAAVPLTAVQLELKAGTWQAEANRAGTVSFDNFKLAKP